MQKNSQLKTLEKDKRSIEWLTSSAPKQREIKMIKMEKGR